MRQKMRRTSTLDKDRFSMDVRKHFFTVRAVDGWNELPDKVRSAKSIDSFKDAYDKWMRERAKSIERRENLKSENRTPESINANTLFFSHKNMLSRSEPREEIEIATNKITTMFLNFSKSEPQRSYKDGSYKKKRV